MGLTDGAKPDPTGLNDYMASASDAEVDEVFRLTRESLAKRGFESGKAKRLDIPIRTTPDSIARLDMHKKGLDETVKALRMHHNCTERELLRGLLVAAYRIATELPRSEHSRYDGLDRERILYREVGPDRTSLLLPTHRDMLFHLLALEFAPKAEPESKHDDGNGRQARPDPGGLGGGAAEAR